MTKYVVARVDEIPVGACKIVALNGRSIGIFNLNGEYYALRNRCPHEGGPLCEGTVTGLRQADRPGHYAYGRPGEIVRCPWHGWEFDIKTGQSWFDPTGVRVRPYPVFIDSNLDGYDPGPFQVETYPVSIESLFVIVDLSH